MFSISETSIDATKLKENFSNSHAGAFVSFEGWVRDHNEGKEVLTLEYEAYDQLCNNEAQAIFAEVREKFGVIEVCCVHRTGALKIGELAVWVGVSSAHRGDAFAACRYLIDEIKSRLPIWKKETYLNGTTGWVNCQTHCAHTQPHQEASPAPLHR
jgi:molybdopterin synthase catalytic subunit